MVHRPTDPVQADPYDFRIPHRPQPAISLSITVGLVGAVLTVLSTIALSFAGARNPGLAWFGVLTVWSAYWGSMLVLWFATASQSG